MEDRSLQLRWSVCLTAMVAFCLLGVAIHAVITYDAPTAGILVEPDAIVSNTGFPSWNGVRQGLRFPDRILEVDGQDVTRPQPGQYRARAFDDAIATAASAGRRSVHVKVATAEGTRELDLGIERLRSVAWWMYAGVLFFSGALYVAAALIAMSVGRGPLARTFAKVAILVALLLFTFFDFHTTRDLVPLTRLAFAMLPMALIGFGLRLPDDAPILARHPWMARALDGTGLLLAAGFLLTHAFGRDAALLEMAIIHLHGVALLSVVGMVMMRFIRARGPRRDMLRPLMFTLVLPCALIAIGLGMHGPVKGAVDIVAFPALALTPLAMMVAFVRHDIWMSRVLLPRFLTRAVIGTIACAFAIGVGTAFAVSLDAPFAGALVAASAGAIVAVALVVLALRVGDKAFFPSLAEYKTTVGQLSEELASIASPQDVVCAVERTVRRWLPCDTIEFALASHEGVVQALAAPALPASGAHKISGSQPAKSAADQLILPVLFRGTKLGTLRVSQKRGGALFTSEDLDLLNTIANQGALAMAHAMAYVELEKRRQHQAAAFRDEREALVETLSAEIAHEVRYPINFFRSVFQRASEGRPLDEDDVEIGCEEVERLERLVSGLRRMATQHVERRVVALAELCGRAEILLRDRIGTRPLALDLGTGGAIRCDVDKVTQVLVNLLANALDATEGRGNVGIRWACGADKAELSIWDTGPGYSGNPSRLFAHWYTTKPRGTGLGLAITCRLVRAHGWTVAPSRNGAITAFVVTIPLVDVVPAVDAGDPGAAETESVTMRTAQSSKGEVA